MTKNIITAVGLAGILAFGTCACSFSAESSTTISTSTTDEEGNTTETTTTTTTSSDGATTEAKSESSDTYKVSEWKNAWTGKTDKGFEVYYAESDEADHAMLIFHNADEGKVSTRTGDLTTNAEEGISTIDYGDGTFTYSVKDTDPTTGEGTYNFGDDFGVGELKRTDMDTLLKSVNEFDPDGKVVAQ